MTTIIIPVLSKPTIEIDFSESELMWAFSRRLGEKIRGGLVDDGKTCEYALLVNGVVVNTFANRMKLVKDLISNPHNSRFGMIDWTLSIGKAFKMQGNASPEGGERETCAICLGSIEEIREGSLSNPLIPTVLKCSHAFHKGCLSHISMPICPLCRAPF